ncbi:MAG: HAD family phosphatase [Planctomycetes bacterium]|nr:HAD family phosphatase [Planctomycetota bacterium]
MPQLAVIFDADGVLVDSYQAHAQSWQRLAEEQGEGMTPEQFAKTFGRTSREIIRQYWSPEGLTDERIRAIDERKEAIYREIIADCLPTMPGALKLIDDLMRSGFLVGVGTSGPPENLALMLRELHGDRWCKASVSAVDVKRGKPDPEVFLLCAERLEVAPRFCAVVEDAAPGVAAAKAAGMLAIGFCSHGHTHDELAAADQIVDQLSELSARKISDWIGARSQRTTA